MGREAGKDVRELDVVALFLHHPGRDGEVEGLALQQALELCYLL